MIIKEMTKIVLRNKDHFLNGGGHLGEAGQINKLFVGNAFPVSYTESITNVFYNSSG